MLKKVTITGADDNVLPGELARLTAAFPFVEWGILFSRSQQGNKRFPSKQFFDDLQQMGGMDLSLHLCGSVVNEVLFGDLSFITAGEIPTWEMFKRVQINTHGKRHGYNLTGLVEVLKMFPDKEFIFQFDNANKAILQGVINQGCSNVSTLFDLSHGAGVLPSEWPSPEPGVKCGYAGGISPDNIAEQIYQIELKAGDLETWIDMETHVRTDKEEFDIDKVRTCLEISSTYIK